MKLGPNITINQKIFWSEYCQVDVEMILLLMVGLVLGSDAVWGQLDVIHPLSAPARGGLTKAEADYIFESLSVLAFWRWMFNYLLGYR